MGDKPLPTLARGLFDLGEIGPFAHSPEKRITSKISRGAIVSMRGCNQQTRRRSIKTTKSVDECDMVSGFGISNRKILFGLTQCLNLILWSTFETSAN